MRDRKLRAWVLLAICSSWLLIGAVGVSAGEASDGSPPYPAAGKQACELGPGGSFQQLADSTTCTVTSQLGTTVYAGSGGPAFIWVQTSTYVKADGANGVDLGPATVGCSRPVGAASADWAMECM